jgi:L-fuculose-phosphate aldolase
MSRWAPSKTRDPQAGAGPVPGSEDSARQALIQSCLAFNAAGLNHNKAGNASVRCKRGSHDGYLITPSGIPYERMGIDDIVWMDLSAAAGDRVSIGRDRIPTGMADQLFAHTDDGLPDTPEPSSEWRMHEVLYRHRDAGAVVHLHSPHATTLACLPRIQREGIPAFHYMVAAAGGVSIRCAPYHLFGTERLAQAALEALHDRQACLLANHGLLAMGSTLEAAVRLAVEVESLARMYWQALQLGEPTVLDAAQMAEVIERFAHYRPRDEPGPSR